MLAKKAPAGAFFFAGAVKKNIFFRATVMHTLSTRCAQVIHRRARARGSGRRNFRRGRHGNAFAASNFRRIE